MFCSNCGRDINNNTVCPYCGYSMTYNNGGQSNFNTGQNFTNLNNFNNYNSRFNQLKPYYQQEFLRFENSNGIYNGKFNICAFLFGNLWALTKGFVVTTFNFFCFNFTCRPFYCRKLLCSNGLVYLLGSLW